MKYLSILFFILNSCGDEKPVYTSKYNIEFYAHDVNFDPLEVEVLLDNLLLISSEYYPVDLTKKVLEGAKLKAHAFNRPVFCFRNHFPSTCPYSVENGEIHFQHNNPAYRGYLAPALTEWLFKNTQVDDRVKSVIGFFSRVRTCEEMFHDNCIRLPE